MSRPLDRPRLRPLRRGFYERPVVELSRALLGQLLVRRERGRLAIGRIVETEAYGGEGVDDSAHSYRGCTPRCASMFGPAGYSYVYMTQGANFCMNVSAQGDRDGKAVLLRAIEAVTGAEVMRRRRLARLSDGPTRRRLAAGHDHELAMGPGRLCVAMALDRRLDGTDVTRADAPVFLAHGDPVEEVRWSPRVGLNPHAFSVGWRWRVFDRHSTAVTRGRPETRRSYRQPLPARAPRADRAPAPPRAD